MFGKWQVTGTNIVLRDKWITVRTDSCMTQRGYELNPYYVLEYPAWVNIFAVTSDCSVIMVRQYRHGYGDISLELPCGVMESQDKDPEAAASREMLEETGYQALSFTNYLRCSPNPATHNNMVYSFLAQGLQFIGNPHLDQTEELQVLTVPLAQVLDLALNGKIVQALHIAAILAACAHEQIKALLRNQKT